MKNIIKPLKLPPIPRSISGLKKDGTKDKRYKAMNTLIELQEYMDSIGGSFSVRTDLGKVE